MQPSGSLTDDIRISRIMSGFLNYVRNAAYASDARNAKQEQELNAYFNFPLPTPDLTNQIKASSRVVYHGSTPYRKCRRLYNHRLKKNKYDRTKRNA